MVGFARKFYRYAMVSGLAVLSTGVIATSPAKAQVTAFKQAVAEAASRDDALSAFYRENGFQPVWTVDSLIGVERRSALLRALRDADQHGLPVKRYNFDALYAQLGDADTPRELGLAEVAMSDAFLTYAKDVQSGMFKPSSLDDDIKRKAPVRDRRENLETFLDSDPSAFIKTLPPTTSQYVGLMKEKKRLEHVIDLGGWGPTVQAKKLKPGDSGKAVVALRNRLITLGYLERSAANTFDTEMQKAVQAFQLANGLEADGVAGAGTIAEINHPPQERLKSIMVAMERERWLNKERGERHVLVNLTDFTARIIDHDAVTFETRSVVGKNQSDRRSPEFSDVMEHMVINPTWNVPRSIATKEYLPMLKRNPNAVSYLKLVNSRGQVVNRGNVNFSQFTARNFPFDIKQAPGSRNALGLVKFMFPNKYNIYLHDTPAKNLFSREVRAYSHGCIRLHQPFDFAYALLARQVDNPKEYFQTRLKTGRETTVDLIQDIPVHIIYRTAFSDAKGHMNYRRDIYGRDAKIWKAMANEGVALDAVQG
ncbi:L,D-transpeptidase family protein [Shimia thalassica]|uniref:L,D-transpeptidase family protein n=1 Tax=Shimia thalassica TaxID=1715693 RepID=UPI003EB9EE7C